MIYMVTVQKNLLRKKEESIFFSISDQLLTELEIIILKQEHVIKNEQM